MQIGLCNPDKEVELNISDLVSIHERKFGKSCKIDKDVTQKYNDLNVTINKNCRIKNSEIENIG